jgi:hypothetical protein
MVLKQFGVVLIISLICYFGINFHQDEFLHFHNLAYLNPNFYLVNFTEGFQAYSKSILNYQFNMPFPYTGTIQGILFYPFFKLFPLIIGKGIYSFLSLILFFYLLRKELNLGEKGTWVMCLFIPFYFTILHDAGPVNLALIIYLTTRRLIHLIYTSKSFLRLLFLSSILLLIWAIACFDKLFFLYLMPSLIPFCLVKINLKDLNWKSSIFVFITLLLLLTLFNQYLNSNLSVKYFSNATPNFETKPLKNHLLDEEKLGLESLIKGVFHPYENKKTLIEIFDDRLEGTNAFIKQFDFSFYLNRNLLSSTYYRHFYFKDYPIFLILFLIAFISQFIIRNFSKLGPAFIRWKNNPNSNDFYKASLYGLSIAMMLATFLILGRVKWGHHFIFVWIPIFGFLFDNSYKFYTSIYLKIYFVFALLMVGINYKISDWFYWISVDYSTIQKHTGASEKKKAIVNFDSWSFYYIRSIDDQNDDIVTWVSPLDTIQMTRLLNLSDSLKIPIINVMNIDYVDTRNKQSFKKKLNSYYKLGRPIKMIYPSQKMPIFEIGYLDKK